MVWSTDLDALMPHTITHKSLTAFSTDGYATEVWSTGVSYAARVVGKQTLVKTFEGTEELATTVVYVKTSSTFGASDQITLPDGSTPPLLAAETYPDETGVHHAKLMFGG